MADPSPQPDTKIPVAEGTTVVVQTTTPSVRYYAVELKNHLYNSGRKVRGWIAFLKGRLSEKSTYVFIGAGVAAASALPVPWSYMSMAVSVIAAMIPDHVIQKDSDDATGKN